MALVTRGTTNSRINDAASHISSLKKKSSTSSSSNPTSSSSSSKSTSKTSSSQTTSSPKTSSSSVSKTVASTPSSSSSKSTSKTSSKTSTKTGSTNPLTTAAAAITGAAAAITGAISSALGTSKPSTSQEKTSAGQTTPSAPTSTPTPGRTLRTSTITPAQTAKENPLTTALKTNKETGKTAVQNYQNTVKTTRAESKAANTKAAQDFIDYIDAGYESNKVTDNLRSLAIEILLPTTLVRNELEREAGTLDTKDPARALETVADVVSLIPVAGGIFGGGTKLAKAAGEAATAAKIGATATKAITKEADMAKLTGITKLIKKVVPSTSKTTTKTTVKTTPTKTTTKTSTAKTSLPKASTVKTTTKTTTRSTPAAASSTRIATKAAPATTSAAKTTAQATKTSTSGSKALTALKAAGAVGSTALTGLWGYTMIDDLMNPEEPVMLIDDTGLPGEALPGEELPLYTEDPGLSSDTGLFDTGLGGAYNAAEQTAEEILEPLAEVPVVGDIVSGAAENGLSLPLILGIVAAVGAFAYFAYKKTVKKSGNRKSSAKKTPKHKAKGAAA